MTKYNFEREVPLRVVMEELRRMNSGKPKQHFVRVRAFYWTRGWVRIPEGAEVDMAKAAVITAQQIGGRVIRFASSDYGVELDLLIPQSIAIAKASKILRNAMSNSFKSRHRGIGPQEGRGYLFKSRERIETLAPLLGTVLSEVQVIHKDEEADKDNSGATAIVLGFETEDEKDAS